MSEPILVQGANASGVSAPDRTPTGRIYAVVLSVGVVCSLAIVTTYEVTRPIIERNRIALRQRAILQVLPSAVSSRAFRFDDSEGRFVKAAGDEDPSQHVFAGYDQDGHLAGFAVQTGAMGYQDYIQVMYGYSPSEEAIIGIEVLESRETPGLGDRIETNAEFLQNFKKLDVRVAPDGGALVHEIEFVKSGKKTSPRQIDGISGATISSQAVAVMLRESSREWIPRIFRRLDDFQSAEVEQ